MKRIFEPDVCYGIMAIAAFLLSIFCGLGQYYTAAAIYFLAGLLADGIMELYRKR